MVTPYASAALPTRVDGVTYADGSTFMPAAEGDLETVTGPEQTPPPVLYGGWVLAYVQFSFIGNIGVQTSYVVLQTGMGDGLWLDLAWCVNTSISGTPLYWLSTVMAGANAVRQSRVVGDAPATALGSNALPLGGQIRFVGKSTITYGTSSSSASLAPGSVPGVYATIKYKLGGIR